MKILCVGEMLIDFTPVDNMTNTYTANPGGAPANVAVSVARNGVDAGFLGKLGNDDFGRMLLKTLAAENVEVLIPKLTDDATTTMAFVTFDESRERSFTFARKPGADMLLSEEDVKNIDFSEWDIVHAGSVSQSGQPSGDAVLLALRMAKEAGKMVSFDINFRDKIWSVQECMAEVNKVFEYVDLLKISEEELDFVGGIDNIHDFMKEKEISVVVLTRGSEGARIFYKGDEVNIPSNKVSVVDTTGAGDAYWGGFISSLANQQVSDTCMLSMERLIKAGRYGAASGGLCVQKHGGIPALPYRKDIEAIVG